MSYPSCWLAYNVCVDACCSWFSCRGVENEKKDNLGVDFDLLKKGQLIVGGLSLLFFYLSDTNGEVF